MEIRMSREAIRSIQTGLNTLGYKPGKINGLFGPNTEEAAERWLAAGGKAASVPVAPKPVSSATIYQGSVRHPVREIIVHCAATQPDWMAGRPLAEKVAEIRRWHTVKGWRDIGYHWIIDRDGKVLPGRAETEIGAHTVGRNSGTIGICLLGGHRSSETDAFLENFTQQQDMTLRQTIDAISLRTSITRISGHNEYATKACPGFNVPIWLKGA
ncbi:MAG: N-acetylmuramoyl-L-alanine amidase [Paracoccus sp. (in: a-proteobacteria)]